MAIGKTPKWGRWDATVLALYLTFAGFLWLLYVQSNSNARSWINAFAIAGYFVVLASHLPYRPSSLKLIWSLLFSVQYLATVWLVKQPATQSIHGSWASILFTAPIALLLVFVFDRLSIWLHKSHFAMLERGGMDTAITGRSRYQNSDILFSILCFALPLPIADWIADQIIG